MEFTTEENKAKVVINAAPLEDAIRLKSAIQKSLISQNINLETISEGDMVNLFLAIDSSPEVYNCLFECLKKSSYDGIKITKETFEPEEARGDLYEVFYYCLKVNIFPFFKSLFSRFGIRFGTTTDTRKQK